MQINKLIKCGVRHYIRNKEQLIHRSNASAIATGARDGCVPLFKAEIYFCVPSNHRVINHWQVIEQLTCLSVRADASEFTMAESTKTVH